MTTAAAPEEALTEPELSAETDRARIARALRDLEAAQARVERDARRVSTETQGTLIAELLPVLDGLDRAILASQHARTASGLVEGVRLVRAQLERVLQGYGMVRIDAATTFDPRVHEAVCVAPVSTRADHGKVLEELAPGYQFGDRLLRPAKVVVGRLLDSRITDVA